MEHEELKKLTDDIAKNHLEYQKAIEEGKLASKSLKEANEKLEKRNVFLTEKMTKIEKDLEEKTDKIKTLYARYEARKMYEEEDGLTELYLKGDDKITDEAARRIAKSILKDPHAKEYQKSFLTVLRDPKNNLKSSKLNSVVEDIQKSSHHEEDSMTKKSLNSMQESGNYLVPPVIELKIHKQLRETSPIRMIADVKMIGSNEFKTTVENRLPIATFEGDPEADNWEDTAPQSYSEVKIPVRSIRARPELTQNLIQDAWLDVETELLNRLSYSFELAENKSFIDGEGNHDFYGLVGFYAKNGKAKPSFDEPQKMPLITKTAASLNAKNGRPLIDALSEMEVTPISGWKRRGAYWIMNKMVKHTMRIIKDDQGQYLLSMWPGFGAVSGLQRIRDGIDGKIFGYGIVECDDMSTAIAAGNYPIGFGHWKNYCVLDRMGINMLIDPYTSNRASIFYKTWKRVGAGLILGQGTVFLKVT